MEPQLTVRNNIFVHLNSPHTHHAIQDCSSWTKYCQWRCYQRYQNRPNSFDSVALIVSLVLRAQQKSRKRMMEPVWTIAISKYITAKGLCRRKFFHRQHIQFVFVRSYGATPKRTQFVMFSRSLVGV